MISIAPRGTDPLAVILSPCVSYIKNVMFSGCLSSSSFCGPTPVPESFGLNGPDERQLCSIFEQIYYDLEERRKQDLVRWEIFRKHGGIMGGAGKTKNKGGDDGAAVVAGGASAALTNGHLVSSGNDGVRGNSSPSSTTNRAPSSTGERTEERRSERSSRGQPAVLHATTIQQLSPSHPVTQSLEAFLQLSLDQVRKYPGYPRSLRTKHFVRFLLFFQNGVLSDCADLLRVGSMRFLLFFQNGVVIGVVRICSG